MSVAGASNAAGGSTNGSAGAASGGTASVAGAPGASGGAGGASPVGGGAGSGTGGTGGGATGGAAGAGGTGPAVIPDTKVVMYLPNWSGSFASWATKIDFTKMTHLNLAFGTVKSGTNDWSMGASDDIGIINRYQTESNVAPLVANLDALVKRLDLDGVDVDIERGGSMKSSGNFPKFVNQLNATFKPEGKLVTAALAQYILEDVGSDAITTAWLNSFDFINLMIYNKNMAPYTSELSWWKTNKGIPKTKLTWGVIFDGSTSADMVKQITTASKADGGVMVWELSLDKSGTLWKTVQGAI